MRSGRSAGFLRAAERNGFAVAAECGWTQPAPGFAGEGSAAVPRSQRIRASAERPAEQPYRPLRPVRLLPRCPDTDQALARGQTGRAGAEQACGGWRDRIARRSPVFAGPPSASSVPGTRPRPLPVPVARPCGGAHTHDWSAYLAGGPPKHARVKDHKILRRGWRWRAGGHPSVSLRMGCCPARQIFAPGRSPAPSVSLTPAPFGGREPRTLPAMVRVALARGVSHAGCIRDN